VTECNATVEEMKAVLDRLPLLRQKALHSGEIESLAIMVRQKDCLFCTFDAAAIGTLPFLDATDRAISAERLMQSSGLTLSPEHRREYKLTEAYFKSKIEKGRQDFIATGL